MFFLLDVHVLIWATIVKYFTVKTNAAKDLLKQFPSHVGTVTTKILMFFPEMKSMFLFQQFQPAILKSQAENVLISQRNSRLMFFGTMFFSVQLYCNQVNFLTAFSSSSSSSSSSFSLFCCQISFGGIAELFWVARILQQSSFFVWSVKDYTVILEIFVSD